jgi:hypothetical protein
MGADFKLSAVEQTGEIRRGVAPGEGVRPRGVHVSVVRPHVKTLESDINFDFVSQVQTAGYAVAFIIRSPAV